MLTALAVIGALVVLGVVFVVYTRLSPKQYLSAGDRALTQAQDDRAAMTSMQTRLGGGHGF